MTTAPTPPFERVLVANRGEIAVRIIRTLRRLGISPTAVYSDADRAARHVIDADVAIHIGPAAATESYLCIERIIDAALRTGSQAIHPGYGFLSENPALAEACDDAGIVFIGPPVSAIEMMADKIRAKATVAHAGVNVVPGHSAAGLDDRGVAELADGVGYPLLLKPSAGGGGKGMRRVDEPAHLAEHLAAARREALGAFGDDTILVERYVQRPRHIEIQVLADRSGHVVHLGERECSLQRRHQKIIEEAPSPFVTPPVRDALGRQALDAARACGYVGAGTVEFIMSGDRPDEFFFMEMNTRLQVEHPVTEMTYGIDLVEWQVRIASGEPLGFEQTELVPRGHAIEARVYAEDPSKDFLPTGGTVVRLEEPTSDGIRVDSSLLTGTVVGAHYDPMLAKVIAHGDTRDDAVRRLDTALGQFEVVGVTTNVAFLRRLLRHDDVRRGTLDTELVARTLSSLNNEADTAELTERAVAMAAVERAVTPLQAEDPWSTTIGWRHGSERTVAHRLAARGSDEMVVSVRWLGTSEFDVAIDGRTARRVTIDRVDDDVLTSIDGVTSAARIDHDGTTTWVTVGGMSIAVEVHDPTSQRLRGAASVGGHGPIRSPMPGRAVAVHVAVGDRVIEGQPVAIVEAMKMEHTLLAPAEGMVSEVLVVAGQTVALDETVVVTVPTPEDHP
jgi:acetyl-CoA/propionyl-CoA carboxylase, biotin carboxylase, biotin carboxyl carrier protein